MCCVHADADGAASDGKQSQSHRIKSMGEGGSSRRPGGSASAISSPRAAWASAEGHDGPGATAFPTSATPAASSSTTGATGPSSAANGGWVTLACSVAFAPGARYLVTAHDSGAVALWGVPSGRCLAVLRGGHSRLAHGLRFSGCGQLLASCSDDGSVCVWEPGAAVRQAAEEGGEALQPVGGVARERCVGLDEATASPRRRAWYKRALSPALKINRLRHHIHCAKRLGLSLLPLSPSASPHPRLHPCTPAPIQDAAPHCPLHTFPTHVHPTHSCPSCCTATTSTPPTSIPPLPPSPPSVETACCACGSPAPPPASPPHPTATPPPARPPWTAACATAPAASCLPRARPTTRRCGCGTRARVCCCGSCRGCGCWAGRRGAAGRCRGRR